jgi:hypothetical protein
LIDVVESYHSLVELEKVDSVRSLSVHAETLISLHDLLHGLLMLGLVE